MSDRKALNIGINQFRDYSEFALKGCVNDVENFSKVLIDYVGFSEEDIVDLIDEDATKTNIIRTLKALVNDAKQGNCSYILLHISTHGTQIPDTGGTEVDHMDEAFVPHDINQIGDEWDRDHIIVDDELAEILSAIPPKVLFEGFGDTCHSGTGLRMLRLLEAFSPVRYLSTEIKVRYVEPVRSTTSSSSLSQEEGLQKHGIRDALRDADMRNYVWWSGCRDDQTSADANIDRMGWNGAFTYYLCNEIRKSGNRKTRSTLMAGLRAALADRYTQVPQLHSRPEYHQFPIGS
jgi:metacaspase-1